MSDRAALARLLALKEKSYALLRWFEAETAKQFGWRDKPFFDHGRAEPAGLRDTLQKILTSVDHAKAWIEESRSMMPRELRPAEDEVQPLARLFVSYVDSSFELTDQRMFPCQDCHGHMGVGWTHLAPRQITPRANDEALAMKEGWLERFAAEMKCALGPGQAGRFIKRHKALSRDIALCAYAAELERRTRFKSQGVGNLALWREITAGRRKIRDAPRRGRNPLRERTRPVRPPYAITADEILASEKTVLAGLRAE